MPPDHIMRGWASAETCRLALPGEAARDIPASCACRWQWLKLSRRFILSGRPRAGCPWHGRPGK